jgi:fumarate reductase iron-sulfur subunit
MILKIKRYNPEFEPPEIVMEYKVEDKEQTLLTALTYIKTTLDNTLTFSSGCRSEVCGSCSVKVNGKEKLACKYKIQDGDLVEPLNLPTIRDLVVDYTKSMNSIVVSKAYLDEYKTSTIDEKEAHSYELQSDCILCSSCYSVCPVFPVNSEFLGPFSLTKVYKFSLDSRENRQKEKIDTIQQNGIWDCTMCGECAFVCPQGIQPNMDIMMLRNKSTAYGYQDPKLAQMASFGSDMSNFGFNPNGF